MYSNCECVPICNKTFVAISILTEFYLLRMNCHLYTLMMDGTGPREIQYSFTTLHVDTLWKTIFNEFSSLGMSIHVTDMCLLCMGEQLPYHVTGYNLIVLCVISVLSFNG